MSNYGGVVFQCLYVTQRKSSWRGKKGKVCKTPEYTKSLGWFLTASIRKCNARKKNCFSSTNLELQKMTKSSVQEPKRPPCLKLDHCVCLTYPGRTRLHLLAQEYQIFPISLKASHVYLMKKVKKNIMEIISISFVHFTLKKKKLCQSFLSQSSCLQAVRFRVKTD